MADIYTVLMNSLRKAKATEPREREDVYARARIAYFHKLLGHRPRLDDEQIEDMMSVFDMAVAFVESDVAPTLPTRRTRELDAAVALLLERQLASANFDVPNIRFEFTERDIEAAPEPELNTPDAYRTHVRQAAARVAQWTDLMVKQIDPASVAALAYASGSPYDRRDWTVRSPAAARESFEVYSPAAPEPVKEASRAREVRLFRTFFPQEGADGTSTPGRFETVARKIVQFFEAWSARLYEASIAAERERRQKSQRPRVFLRTPRYDEAAARQRRFRRNLFNRVIPPAAALTTVGIILAVTQFYGREIVDRVEDGLRPREEVRVEQPPPAPEPVIPKTEIAASGAPINAMSPDAVLFDGTDASVFVANEAHPIKTLAEGDERFVRITSSLSDSADARLLIPPPVAERLAGREAHVVVTARSATEEGSGTVRFAYQAGDDVTPFVAQPLGKDYRRLELVWNVPTGAGTAPHAILIEPGLLGLGTSVDIKEAVVYLPR